MLSVTDRLLITYGILLRQFSLLWQLCTVAHGIFYMADINNLLLVSNIMIIFPDIFKTAFEWLSLA